MNELHEHKNWWHRNWKWFIPMLAILVMFTTLISSSEVGTRVADIVKAYVDPNLMSNALSKAQENEKVKELFGTLEPIDGMDIMQGIVKYSNNDSTIDIYVHINGSKGNGRMRVFADRNKNKWEYNTIAIASEKLKKPIVVVENVK